MRIDPKEAIGGYPAVLARDALRRLRIHLDWDLAQLESVAGYSAAESRALVRDLRGVGRACGIRAALVRDADWPGPIVGDCLCSREAATGERALREFMTRVDHVKRDRRYLGKVTN